MRILLEEHLRSISEPAKTPDEELAFVRKHCPLVYEGIQYIDRYIQTIRGGRRPEHV